MAGKLLLRAEPSACCRQLRSVKWELLVCALQRGVDVDVLAEPLLQYQRHLARDTEHSRAMIAQRRDLALVQHGIAGDKHHPTDVTLTWTVQQDVPQMRRNDVLDDVGIVVALHDDLLAQLTAVGERGRRNHHGDAEDALQHDLR